MNISMNNPLVSVVTPAYNGEKYLDECIKSVLDQTYNNFEYIIVNNCSTDTTRVIAERYADMDSRIKVYNYEEFVGVIQSHNRALRLISPISKYCKVLSADDWLFPECLSRMVSIAEENPTVGIVGSYQLTGGGNRWCVNWGGLPYSNTAIPGPEICRLTLLSILYVFGVPTSTLYRSDLIRSTDNFYPNMTDAADVSAYFEYLRNTDFGFVHQVLSYERVHENAVRTKRNSFGYEPDNLRNMLEYGPVYLSEDEYNITLEEVLSKYYRSLAVGVFNFREKEFWSYHKKRLEELGYPFFSIRLGKAVCMKFLDLLFNPKQTIGKIQGKLKNK